MIMEKQRKSKQKQLMIFLPVLIQAAALLFLLLRVPYGWCFNDEPFIISLAQRLYMGDRLILDEWNPAQVFGPVLLPFYYVFRLFCQDNTGILLTFRYMYCAVWWSTCLFIYHVIKKYTHSVTASLCIFIYLVLFSPLDNMTLSYTSIGLASCLMLSCIILKAKDLLQKNLILFSVMLSACITILILCSPYMAGAYFLILMTAIWKSKKRNSSEYECLYRSVRWSGGFVFLFFVIFFLCFVRMKGEDWKSYLECIRLILSNPDHSNTNILSKLFACFAEIIDKNRLFSAIIGISIACSFYKKGVRQYRLVLFIICVCGYLYAEYCYLSNNIYVKFNQQMIDIAILGFAAFSLLEDKPWDLFFSFTIVGLIYTFVNYLATNTGLYSIGMTLSVCGVGSIVYVVKLCQELKAQYLKEGVLFFIFPLICAGIMVTQFSSELFTRTIRQYWDEEPAALTETIQIGAAKGLKTTSERKDEYEQQYEELKTLLDCVTEKEEKRFVCFTASPVIYLDADMRFGTFTSWSFPYQDDYMDYLNKYEEITHHSGERVFYISRQEDLPDTFPTEHYQVFSTGKSAVFVPRDTM